jgi:hypothetical protein
MSAEQKLFLTERSKTSRLNVYFEISWCCLRRTKNHSFCANLTSILWVLKMKFNRLATLAGGCSILMASVVLSASASEFKTDRSNKQTVRPHKISQRINSSKVKANSAKSLGVIPAIDLTKTPQLLSQQTIDQTNPTPVNDPATPSGVTVPIDASPTTTPTNPAPTLDGAPATDPAPAPTAPSSTEPQFPSGEQVKPDPSTVDPGRRTRSGSSYVGIGANVGGFGNTSVGSPGLMLYGKVGLTRYFSIRPAVVTDFSNDATFILPATFDLAPIRLGSVNDNAISVAPYIGGGATVTTDGDARALLTGGVDVPISSRLTATLGLNTTFGDDVDLGGFIGVGYNF